MEEMKRALDVTDQFLDVALQDENRLRDPTFMMHLMDIRQKHKKTFAVIKEIYDLSSSKDATSVKISHSFTGQQASGLLLHLADSKIYQNDAKNAWTDNDNHEHSHSLQSLMRTQKHIWSEEQKFEYTEKWIPKADVSATAIKGSCLRSDTRPIRESHSWRFVNELIEKKKIEELEEMEKIVLLRNRARKVPRSTYEPRYQQLCEKEEKAREARHQRAVEMLKKMRLSRVGTRFESENFHLRRCISAEAPDWNKREVFKARDVPLSVYVSPYKDEIQACKRARRKTERAAQLILTSRAPSGLEEHAMRSKVQHHLRHGKYCTAREPKHNNRYSRKLRQSYIFTLFQVSFHASQEKSVVQKIPNFKKLHEQLLDKLEKAAAKRPITVVTPFYFQTDERTINHKCNHEIPLPKIHRRSHSMGNLREYNGPGIRLNHASLLRHEANRIRAQKLEAEQNFSQKFWELMKKRGELARIKLKQRFSTEVTTVCDVQRRLKEKKTKEQERAAQYRNELEEMKRRVNTRALIVEQQEMLIKMQRFERKYKETIRAAKSNTRKVCIQREYSNRCKEEMIITSSDQQAMVISELNPDSNEMQISKTEIHSNSLYVSDSDGKDKESEHLSEGGDTDGDNSDDDIVDGDDYDDDDNYDDDESDDVEEDDDDNEESENESNVDDASKFGTNSESSMHS